MRDFVIWTPKKPLLCTLKCSTELEWGSFTLLLWGTKRSLAPYRLVGWVDVACDLTMGIIHRCCGEVPFSRIMSRGTRIGMESVGLLGEFCMTSVWARWDTPWEPSGTYQEDLARRLEQGRDKRKKFEMTVLMGTYLNTYADGATETFQLLYAYGWKVGLAQFPLSMPKEGLSWWCSWAGGISLQLHICPNRWPSPTERRVSLRYSLCVNSIASL